MNRIVASRGLKAVTAAAMIGLGWFSFSERAAASSAEKSAAEKAAAKAEEQASEARLQNQLSFLESLRDQKLDRLLETHCEQMLAGSSIDDPQLKSRLTVELAESIGARAFQTLEGSERHALWKQADDLVAQLLAESTDHPQGHMVRYRHSGSLIERSAYLHNLSKVLEGDREAAKAARDAAAQAVSELTSAIKLVTEEIDRRSQGAKAPRGSLRQDELTSLLTAADFRLGSAWLAVARSTPDGAERQRAIPKAEASLTIYARDYSPLPIALEAHLAYAELFAIQGKHDEAIATLRRLDREETPRSYLLRARLMLGRTLLAAGKVEDAITLFDVAERDRLGGAEWSLLLFEALLRKSDQLRAGDAAASRAMLDRSLHILDEVEDKYGRYWGRRGEQALLRLGDLSAVGDHLPLMRRLANLRRQEKNWKGALDLYDKAAALAKTAEDAQLAGEMQFAAGSVAFEMEDYAAAAKRMTALNDAHPGHPRAASAILAAAYSYARRYAKTKDAADLDLYRSTLESHLRAFNHAEATPEAHYLLADLFERSGKWQDALRHYQAVPVEHRRFVLSLEAVGTILVDRAADADPAAVKQGIDYLTPIDDEPPPALDAQPGGQRALAAGRLALATLWVTATGLRAEQAERLLRERLVNEPVAANDKKGEAIRARAWLMLLQFALKRQSAADAAAVAKEGFPNAAGTLLRAMAAFDPQSELMDAKERSCQIAVIEAAAAKLLAEPDALPERDSLSKRDRFNLRLLHAQALSAKGEQSAAQRLLKALEDEAPREPRVQFALARSLLVERRLKESLAIWNKLLSGYASGSPDWFTAAAGAVECLYYMGEKDKSHAMLRFALALEAPDAPAQQKERLARLKKLVGLTE